MKPQYHFEIHNPSHSEAIQKRLFELGYFWIGDSKPRVQLTNSGSLQISEDKRITHMPEREWGRNKGYEQATLDDLYSDKFTGPKPIIVPLNDSYSAEVSKEGISVSVDGVKQTELSYPLSVLDLLVEAKGKVGAEKTLSERVQIVVHNEAHSRAVQAKLFELGYGWSSSTNTEYRQTFREEAKWIYLPLDKKHSLSWDRMSHSHPNRPYVTLDDLYGPKFTGVSEVEVKLSGPYSAKVSKDKLEVGCQSFPISVLDALLAARKEVTEG